MIIPNFTKPNAQSHITLGKKADPKNINSQNDSKRV